MNTFQPKLKDIKREWHLVDAKDQVLGRLTSKIAQKLIGKHKTYYVPHLDCGDYIVVINAEKIKVTGDKLNQKTYYRHSGFPGALKEEKLGKLLDRRPDRVIELAVRGMLPKNKLRDPRLRRLKVFTSDVHPYQDKLDQKSKQKTK